MSWNSYWGSRESDEDAEKIYRVHPIWRGIGFMLMVIIPLISFALADLGIQYAWANVPGFVLSSDLRGVLTLPLYGTVQDIRAVAILAVVIMFVLFALMGFLTSLGVSLAGGSPRDKLEAPPEKYKPKKRLK